MRWSKRKQRAESLFAESVKGRVELRATRYREAHDQDGRGFITFDGEEVWNMCSFKSRSILYAKASSLEEDGNLPAQEAWKRAQKAMLTDGVIDQYDFYDTLDEYRSNPIETSLASKNALTRSLVMLDARFGKRRLLKLDVSNETEMVRMFYEIRCKCENISSGKASA